MSGRWWLCAASLACALAGACTEDGAVRLRVELPEDPALDPLAGNASSLTLRVQTDGEPERVETRSLAGDAAALDFGQVPIASGVRMSLMAQAPSGRLVGFGRAADRLEVAADALVEVTIPLRRPFAYVAGASRLAAFDSSLEPGGEYSSWIDTGGKPAAAAATPDGSQLAVVAGGTLRLVSSSTHALLPVPAVALAAGATRVAISPDSRWAVVTHGAGGGVSIVDLSAQRAGDATAMFVPLPAAGPVGITADTAYVLVDPARGGCGGVSSIRPVSLAAPEQPRDVLPLGTSASDLAADPDTGRILVAEPCRDMVVLIDPAGDTAVESDLIGLPRPSAVALAGDRVFAAGRAVDARGARIVLASADLDGASATVLELPVAEESALSSSLTMPGQSAEVRMTADTIEATDLAVIPSGAHVAILAHATFHATETIRTVDVLGVPVDVVILPTIDMETHEYLLLDAASGTAVQRTRTSCSIEWDREVAVLDKWACTLTPGQDTSDESFAPSGVSVLYGSP